MVMKTPHPFLTPTCQNAVSNRWYSRANAIRRTAEPQLGLAYRWSWLSGEVVGVAGFESWPLGDGASVGSDAFGSVVPWLWPACG